MPDYWRKPLAAFATVNDRFQVLPEIAALDHALPEELLHCSLKAPPLSGPHAG
ncbi:MAG: hypothetical protein RQ739_13685 [Desulfotignum sp.]|nr:hypothetical protein [Desulfotignum sp.]